MNEFEKVLDFYIKANNNKRDICIKRNNKRDYSYAELTVIGALYALSLESESRTPMFIDYDKIIRMIFASTMRYYANDLKNVQYYKNLYKELENDNSNEAIVANDILDRIFNDIDYFENPIYDYENYVKKSLKLQNTIRKGHIYWKVNDERLESILEHIYGCCILVMGYESEYKMSLDYNELIKMLLVHETEEIEIGDLTEWDINSNDKKELGKIAVDKVLSELKSGKRIKSLIDEFNSKETVLSHYAYLIDKIEYDLQVKIYDLDNKYNFNNIPNNNVTISNKVKEIIDNGAKSVFDIHYEYDKNKFENTRSMRRLLEESKKL